MALYYTSYFGLVRLNNAGPEAKNWAVTDLNPEILSKLVFAVSRHTHTGATPVKYPGYNYATPATPITVTLQEVSQSTPGGVLAPGTAVGARFSYTDAYGLETDASPEQVLTLSPVIAAPSAPSAGPAVSTPVAAALSGGTYAYGITKGKGAGETQLSAVALVEVPFANTINTSYAVPITFDPVADYSDGTDKLNIYRSTGLASTFQLVKTYTDPGAFGTPITIIDDGTLENAAKSPPAASTFDRNKSVRIDASALSPHPSDARKLNLYITQTPGVYGTNHLLETVDLTTPTGPNPSTPTKNDFTYLGTENFQPDYPKEFTQIPQLPNKINLGTETYGAPVLTASTDFGGYESARFVLPRNLQNAASTPGAVYYDPTSTSVKFNLDGSWVTLTTPTGSFVHSQNEVGGHSTDRIYFSKGTEGYNVTELLSIIATPVAATPITPAPKPTLMRKVVQPVYRSDEIANNVSTTSTSLTSLVSMPTGILPIEPQFAGQWLEIIFTGSFIVDPQGASSATASFQFEIDGSLVQGEQTYRSFTAAATPTHVPVQIYFATPISSNVSQKGLGTLRVMWLTTNGRVTALSKRTTLFAKLLF